MKVLFIVPTMGIHKGLELTIESIEKSELPDELKISHSSGEFAYSPFDYTIMLVTENEQLEYLKVKHKNIEIVKCEKGTLFTKKINLGLRTIFNRDSARVYDIVCFLNDDIYFAKSALKRILKYFNDTKLHLVLNPFSNCDKGWLHNEDTGIGVGLPIDWLTEDKKKYINEYGCNIKKEGIYYTKHVALYCTFMRTEDVLKLGYLNESMELVYSDFEYCERATKYDTMPAWTRDAFVFHFGAIARKHLEKQDSVSYHDRDHKDKFHYENKKKKILIYSGKSWEKWNVRNLSKGGIGGSETCLVYLARHLVQYGYDVTCVIDSNIDYELNDGVKYNSLTWPITSKEFDRFDVIISSRVPNISKYLENKKSILWVHDITFGDDLNVLKEIDGFKKIVLLSDWHREFWKKYHFDYKVCVIPDGVELSRFKKRTNINYGNFIYSSSWDRGLDNVITILDEVRKRTNIDIILDVFYGNDNLLKVAKQYGYKWLEKFNDDIIKEIESRQWIKVHGRVDQNILSMHFVNSFAWLYPTYFFETCCITALEAMASGLPLIHNASAGLERFKNVGIVIPGKIDSRLMNGFNNFEPYINMVIELLLNPDLWKKLSEKSLSEVQQYTWQKIVKENWIQLIESI